MKKVEKTKWRVLYGLLLIFMMNACITSEDVKPENDDDDNDEEVIDEENDETVDLAVLGVTPADGSTDVDPNLAEILIEFSKPIDLGTVENSTFSLAREGSNTTEYATITQSGSTVIFKFDNPGLDEGYTYFLRITTGVKDKEGNALSETFSSTFTISGDNDRPTLESSSIGLGGVDADVEANTSIVLTFSETIDSGSLSGITLTNTDDNTEVEMEVSQEGRKVTLSPSGMKENTNYFLVIPQGLADLSGNTLYAMIRIRFKTAKTPVDLPEWYEGLWYDSAGKLAFQIDLGATESTIFVDGAAYRFDSKNVTKLEDQFENRKYQVDTEFGSVSKVFYLRDVGNTNKLEVSHVSSDSHYIEHAKVNAQTVNHVEYSDFGGGSFSQEVYGTWYERDSNGNVKNSFTMTNRGQWSVYLEDSRGKLRIDLHTEAIYWEPVGYSESKFADISVMANSSPY
ncbi:hypothetical protein BFP72_18700 [Reichenbachiella sp. 5M10]|uniref:Ig-like domain-containing protein n=1 Tax=Reichenbachiella sp. 5M10 TaxID=1889772 RepID=UPI000C15E211|nr:Ig-like domain-containing protein [Reichenbachiella sp. 5M10]PIB37294.1 hypothetical protein BFP72_18700 [Reichenbachiella sp. 5M10]